jgi:CheY-like chemotaxis protein
MLNFLVIEDDESIRKIMGWVLDSLGYPSVLKATGEEALTDPQVVDHEFSVLWVDLSLPGMSGEEFVKQWISRIARSSPLPDIIFCSALQEGGLRVSAAQLQLGYDQARMYFLPKPFRLDEFERLVQKINASRLALKSA